MLLACLCASATLDVGRTNLQEGPAPCEPTMAAWMQALQHAAANGPGTCDKLVHGALAASLELPSKHATAILHGLADLANQAPSGGCIFYIVYVLDMPLPSCMV